MTHRLGAYLSYCAALSLLAIVKPAGATAGTHAPAVSTYDTRASSIVFAYRHGFSSAGSFNTFSYNANFTSTTGRLSAQFGIHYVNYRETGVETRAHGVGGSGVAVLEYPVAARWENGIPKVALALHMGGVPTAYISGERNFLTLPLVLGFGVPLSPTRFLTFTPWYELAVSANLDTIVRPENVTVGYDDVIVDPKKMTASLREGAVQDALSKGVTIDVGVSVPMRVGLDGTVHLGKTVDFNVYGMLSTLGGAFSGAAVKTFGGALVIRWDDIVPAVLPKAPEEVHEDCEATERRFRACPISRTWLSPEQRGQAPTSPATPAPTPKAAPTPSTPAPVGPAPVVPAAPAPETAPTPSTTSFPAQ